MPIYLVLQVLFLITFFSLLPGLPKSTPCLPAGMAAFPKLSAQRPNAHPHPGGIHSLGAGI